ncbi:MAG: hypothetical protein WC183_14920, partial [Methanosarcina sp.]
IENEPLENQYQQSCNPDRDQEPCRLLADKIVQVVLFVLEALHQSEAGEHEECAHQQMPHSRDDIIGEHAAEMENENAHYQHSSEPVCLFEGKCTI